MIRRKRLFGIPPAAAAAAVAAENPVLDWNNTTITMALAASQVTAPGSNSQPCSIFYLACVHLASCLTGSLATTLKHFFGTPNVTVVVSSAVTNTSRTFTRLEEWEREVEMARIYAGFHYHHSVIEGVGLGRSVANQLTREYFQPVHHE